MPADRIRTRPAPGTATEADVLWILDHEDRICEMIDGTLVEKAMSAEASAIALWIGALLNQFVRPRRLGWILGPDGILRISTDRLRAPDVSFIKRSEIRGERFPTAPIPQLSPSLAVEVLSPSTTSREMNEKLDDYFSAGTELVWIVDPASNSIRVFSSRENEVRLGINDTLDGGTVLPGFSVPVADIFSAIE